MRRLVAASALLLALAGCHDDASSASAQEGKRDQQPKRVRTARVESRQIGATVQVNGTLDAYEKATIGAKVPGRVQILAVDLGTRVRRGQLIARVDPTDYSIRLQQAEAALAQARVRLGLSADGASDGVDASQTPTVREARAVLDEAGANRVRYQSLLAAGLVSKADYDQVVSRARVAESQYQDALEEIRNRQGVAMQRRAELALARQQLADTSAVAPFDGVVQQRIASLGEYLAAGAPIAELVKIDPLRFRADVPERDAVAIRVGQPVRLDVDGAPRDTGGRVTRISPTITQRTRILQLEADIPNDGTMRAGSFARATIVTDATSTSLAVPKDALVTFAGIDKVVVVEKEKAKEKPVTTGRRAGDWIEVLSGVKAGEEVVIAPGNLRSGQPVVTR